MSAALLTSLIALATFAAGLALGRLSRRAPAADSAIAAENADLRRRMDELAAALLAAGEGVRRGPD